MNGLSKTIGGKAQVRRVGAEVPWPYPQRREEWPWAITPWNWSETRDQFEARRKARSEI